MPFFYHQFKNYINRDPLSDWFDIMESKTDLYQKDKKNEFQIELETQKENYKLEFKKKFQSENKFYENLNHTEILQKIKNSEECIIYQSTLYHSKYNIYVKPDLIIHRNIFKQYFPEIQIDLPNYLVIDILYRVLHFNSDQTDLLNQGNIYYHKCKMFVASNCIQKINCGFFIGKEYRTKNKILNKKENIGFFPFHNEFIISIQESIAWINKLNKYYDNWILYPKPSVKELYPNMNRKDGNWTSEKKKLAESIKEITLVWNISFNKRCMLLEKGITKWDDPILLSNIYPYQIRDNEREFIQEKIIQINSQNNINIEPRKIKNYDFLKIIQNKKNSIILDIESVINLEEKQSYFNNQNKIEDPRICIIGTIINQDNYPFKDFTIRYLTNQEEKKIIQYWINYLTNLFQTKIKIYHWGNAEKIYLDYMKQKYPDLNYPEFECIDLLYYFKLEPITIKGCFSYGLKAIVKQLYNLNLIQNQWEDDTTGIDAMVQILKTSKEAERKNIPIKRFTQIKKIIYYNYMDCKVIVDILQMLSNMI